MNTIQKIISNIDNHNTIEVVGFHLCGKSTLSETLYEQMNVSTSSVLLQSAQKWIHSNAHQVTEDNRLSVNSEIETVINRLLENNGYWIIDDAEIMLAHASEKIILRIEEMVRKKKIQIILIRNRFVLENQGWFHDRRSLLNIDLPAIEMKAFDINKAYEVSTTFFSDNNCHQRSEWLAAWSGGIPGLMYELYHFTPEWPHIDSFPNHMKQYIHQVSHNYLLHDKTRTNVIKALCMGLLPPRRMLSDDANIEIGYLMLIGMISSDLSEGYQFQGKFWEHVAFSISPKLQMTKNSFENQGLELEILFNSSGFGPGLCEDLDLENEEGRLAEAFAQHLFCLIYLPELVISIVDFLVEALGRVGLRVLLSQIDKVEKSLSAKKLSEKLLLQLGIHS